MNDRSSRRIRAAEFDEAWMHNRSSEMMLLPAARMHRKRWEFAAIAQVYVDRIGEGGHVLGFGVGTEPLPAWFAAHGASVLATDRPDPGLWGDSGQHAHGREALPNGGICDPDVFAQNVLFRPLDMRHLPSSFLDSDPSRETFDLLWSCSTIEHLGGLIPGLQFVLDSMRFLKPGGLAVHTTELSLRPDRTTLDGKDLCVFRPCDFDELADALVAQGDHLWPIDVRQGDRPEDRLIDLPPFEGDPHLALELGGVPFTSVLFVVEKDGSR